VLAKEDCEVGMKQLSEETEKKYLSGLKDRDSVVFGKVYDLYWSGLYVSAFNVLGSREQSEDVVQEVFSNLWSNAANIEIKNLKAWLYTAVRYQVFNVLRTGKVRDRFQNLYLFEIETENIGELKLTNEDLEKRLWGALEQLSPRCKEIFVLSRFEYLSNNEIAEALSISVKTVENQISIAQRELKLLLKDFSLLLLIIYFNL